MGVAHGDCVLQVELFSQSSEIVGVGVHLVTIPRLGGTAVPSPVVGDDSKAMLAVRLPVVRAQRPAMAKHHRLPKCPVFQGNRVHKLRVC